MTIYYGRPLNKPKLVTNPLRVPSSVKIGGEISYWIKVLQGRFTRYRSRRQLMNLSDHQLQDIGITREQALEEINKSFWR